MLLARMQTDIGDIKDIRILGKGFYHIELNSTESLKVLLAQNPLKPRSARGVFTKWKPNFNPTEAIANEEHLYWVNAIFLRLSKEYMPLITRVGASLGAVLQEPESMASRIRKADGLPSVLSRPPSKNSATSNSGV
ncbi:hypothetical protein KP509_22G039400 [Ceratopteris richardii]|uniref:Uncharacterized protein n=1 Tax=Ceratopteris richardii TaxID=49495 RepID=A0A8T2S6X6_CERRI|nr:hypothetical protein KP509_22G039400 [Ceratopteris richardii]